MCVGTSLIVTWITGSSESVASESVAMYACAYMGMYWGASFVVVCTTWVCLSLPTGIYRKREREKERK